MIDNIEWVKIQIRRLCLEGFSQEQIAEELNVSEGTVSALMQELKQSDSTLSWQHEIAVVCNKYGIPIQQLASNLAFSNAIKVKSLQDDKIEAVLKTINTACTQDASLSPETVADLFLQFCDLAMKNNNTCPIKVCKEVESKYDELNKLNQWIEQTEKKACQAQEDLQKELERCNTTSQVLQVFLSLKEDFEKVGLDFDNREEILNILYNLAVMDNNPQIIIDEVKNIRFLNLERLSLVGECEKIEKILENLKKMEEEQKSALGLLSTAANVIKKILQKGNSQESIIKLFEILSKNQDLSLDQFAYDVDTYGGIQAAIAKKFLDSIRSIEAAKKLTNSGTGYDSIPTSSVI